MAELKQIKSNEEYQAFVESPDTLNVVKIGAPWCGPCRVIEKVLTELTDEETEGVSIAAVNADDEWFEAKATELGIRGIPVVIGYKNGEESERIRGSFTKENLLGFFAKNK